VSYRVAIIDDRFGAYEQEESILGPIATLEVTRSTDPGDIAAGVRDADAVIVNLEPIPRPTIEGMRRCKIICRYGVGYDNVDIAAATECGIWVARVPDYGIEDVSDHALGLFLACVRKIPYTDRGIRDGGWGFRRNRPSYRIRGKTFGLLGYGAIARALHRKLSGLGLARVLAHDPYVDAAEMRAAGAEPAGVDEVLAASDYVSIHAPLTPETRGMIDQARLAAMKPTAIIVNTARGGIIDESALADALRAGRIGYAALDVFETEPLAADSPLRELDTVILTDHHAYYTEESVVELKTKAAQRVRTVLEGGVPEAALNDPRRPA
jgi:D-3-phosphoglycerate dehydrogenase